VIEAFEVAARRSDLEHSRRYIKQSTKVLYFTSIQRPAVGVALAVELKTKLAANKFCRTTWMHT